MKTELSFVVASLLLSVGSLFLAVTSNVLGQQVNYLDYLPFFNWMAAGMLALSVAGLLVGLVGIWKARGRSASLWLANAMALLLIGHYMFNP